MSFDERWLSPCGVVPVDIPTTGELIREIQRLRARTEVVALEQRKMMRAALEGCRGLAEAEAAHGSKVWKRAIGLIDDALNYREPVSPQQEKSK